MNCVIHSKAQQKGYCQVSSCQYYCSEVCMDCISQINQTSSCQPSHIQTIQNMEKCLTEFKQRNFQRLENIQIQCMIQKYMLISEFKQYLKQWIYKIYSFNDLLSQLNLFYAKEWTSMSIEDYLKRLQLGNMSLNEYLENKSHQVLLLDSKKDELLRAQIQQTYSKPQSKVFNNYDKLFENILKSLSDTQSNIFKSLQRIITYKKKLLDDNEKIVLLETVIMEGYNIKSNAQVDKILTNNEYCSDLQEHQRLYIESFAQCYRYEKNKSSQSIDDALQKINKSLSMRQNPKAHRIKGILHYFKGEYQQSIQTYDQSLEIDPQNIQCYNNKAISLEKIGKYDEAIEMYNKALSLDPYFAIGYNGKGNTLQSQHKYFESIAMYDLAISMNPKLIEAYNNKGNSLDKLGKHQDAIEQYDIAIKLDEQYVDAYNGKGNALDNLKQHQEAIVQYEQVINLDPHYIHAYNGLGSAYHNLGDFKQAIKYFDIAVQQDPKYYKAYLNKGISLLQIKEFAQAHQIFTQYLSKNPIEISKIQQYIDMCDPF